MRTRSRRRPRDSGVCEVLRPHCRKLVTEQNHPLYVARGNEQPLLEQLIGADPPEGGMDAYIANLDRQSR